MQKELILEGAQMTCHQHHHPSRIKLACCHHSTRVTPAPTRGTNTEGLPERGFDSCLLYNRQVGGSFRWLVKHKNQLLWELCLHWLFPLSLLSHSPSHREGNGGYGPDVVVEEVVRWSLRKLSSVSWSTSSWSTAPSTIIMLSSFSSSLLKDKSSFSLTFLQSLIILSQPIKIWIHKVWNQFQKATDAFHTNTHGTA